jgi:cellobiose phosphorylase
VAQPFFTLSSRWSVSTDLTIFDGDVLVFRGGDLSPEQVRGERITVAADVYSVAPNVGRGGWSWYTGSAGWMYRLIVESFLGLKLEVDRLSLKPCVPKEWR